MPISDGEVRQLLERTERIEIRQHEQGAALKRLSRTVYGDDEYPGIRAIVVGTQEKTNQIDDKIQSWEDRIHGAKWVVGGAAFLLTSGALAAIINLVAGG